MHEAEDSKSCPRCGALNHCMAASDPLGCWCMKLPETLAMPEGEASCLCSSCLKSALAEL